MRKQAFFDDDSQTRRESYRVLDFSFLSQTKIHPSKSPLTSLPMPKRSYLLFAVAIIISPLLLQHMIPAAIKNQYTFFCEEETGHVFGRTYTKKKLKAMCVLKRRSRESREK